MHQEHNIPWNLLAQNVKFVHENPAYTPRTTGFFAKSPSANELNHFVRTLTSTIRTFSDTERAKYPSTWPQPFPTSDPVIYSDEVKAKHPEFLDDQRQKIETWINRTHREGRSPLDKPTYSTSHGDLADVVKVLFAEGVDTESDDDTRKRSTETLMMLANHPDIPLGTMVNLSWGHHFGWSRVMESALRTYVLFNLIVAVGNRDGGAVGRGEGGKEDLLSSGAYSDMQFYASAYHTETSSMDYDAQQVPHRAFWKGAREADDAATKGGRKPGARGKNAQTGREKPPLMHLDVTKLKEYLKLNFALLYRYDMVVRECGLDPEWEREIVYLLRMMVQGFKLDDGQWNEDEKRWSPVFI